MHTHLFKMLMTPDWTKNLDRDQAWGYHERGYPYESKFAILHAD